MSFNAKTIMDVFKKGNGRCWYCGTEITIDSHFVGVDSKTYAIDHFMSKKEGGTDDLYNLVPSCWGCNSTKKNHSLEIFRDIKTRNIYGIPYFNEEQLDYLASNGITLPEVDPYIFYFERINHE